MRKCCFSPAVVPVILLLGSLLSGQQQAGLSAASVTIPRLVSFSGKVTDVQGKGVAGVAGVTFAIYGEQSGGAPLWIETQSVSADARGNYSAQLGASKVAGLSLDLFSTGEARWLGVRVNGGEEQPRVLLLSVPYALKAADAETIGGLPPSAFVLAAQPASGGGISTTTSTETSPNAPPPAALTGSGTANHIPLWTGASTQGNSALFQTGTGANAKIGLKTTTPTATLDVNGTVTIRSLLNLPATATATAAAGANSNQIGLVASAFNSGSNIAANQVFRWIAEPAGNNTASPGATLNLLFGVPPATPAETGLKINNKGQITFAAGQAFPGSGTGSVSSVGFSAPSSDFTVSGSPVTGSGTLGLNWVIPPTSQNVTNAIVKRDSQGDIYVDAVLSSTIISNTMSTDEIIAFGSNSGFAVWGENSTGSGPGMIASTAATVANKQGYGPDGIDGITHTDGGDGVAGYADSAGDGVFGYSASGFGAFFVGNVDVDGNLSKAAGSFKIDHPLDPANKYLYHSFVESPDMKNIYDGVATLNGSGEAVVEMPAWFDALNRDFRYQLTCIGGFAPVYIADEMSNNRFKIAGGKQGMKVSWQVTGTRQDAWANAHRIPVEQMKSAQDRGLYLHPELFGAPEESSIAAAHHPGLQKVIRERKAKQAAGAGK